MSEKISTLPPKITEKDIRWVTDILDFLPKNAFCEEDRKDSRQNVLMSMEPMDVVACPGSGKTTLLVAKLAILAEKWRHRTRGICVLSHTNAARREIESRIGNTVAGKRLLSYPHFIGTIHGFVNEYLAMPWLRSLGFPINLIDSEICIKRRWNALPYKIRECLEKHHYNPSILSAKATDFTIGEIRWGKGKVLGKDSNTYRWIQQVCMNSAKEGYFCYDEMFVWANDLIDKIADVVKVIRERFFILFIDEAQDNSEAQSAIIHRIFLEGDNPVIRQRFGDENQAIYNFVGDKGATTDVFPDEKIKRSISHSHRFGEKIACLTDPLGVMPFGMKGMGPNKFLESQKKEGVHTIFLFENKDAGKVLDAYAELLFDTFSRQELEDGLFTAIGQVHRPPEKKADNKLPQHVGQYWEDYDFELTRTTPIANTFVQYVLAGQAKAESTGEIYPAIKLIAEGILRLAGMVESERVFQRHKSNHLYVMQLLEKNADAQYNYEKLIATFVTKKGTLTRECWDCEWCGIVQNIAETIAEKPLSTREAKFFMMWRDCTEDSATLPNARKRKDNFYTYSKDDKKVVIRVGSIHSVKGETHTATLVLETFWHNHNLEKLLEWIDGRNYGIRGGNAVRQKDRLKLHYVGMTRPTHLLCLAMKRSTFEDSNNILNQKMVHRLKQHGWQVKLI